MKNSMFKAIATLACAAALTACGGGANNDDTTPLPPQPAYTMAAGEVVGTSPTAVASGDLVSYYATGYVYDETKADKKGGKPFITPRVGAPQVVTVGVGAVIPGIDQGLVGMKVGGKRTWLIPANMAFGPAGYTDAAGTLQVPANTAVVFDLEVVSFTTLSLIPKTDTVIGTGATAATRNLVTINYTGYLRDNNKADKKGTKFESSSAPFSFLLNVDSRIQGWDLGILGMKVGGKRTLEVPANMAWGKDGRKDNAGNVIVPANTDVVYDIELTAVNATPPAQTTQPPFQIIDDVIGTGTLAAAKGHTLSVQYSGYLYNGSVTDKKGLRFDTSRITGTPFSVKLGDNKVIQGWENGLLGVKAGGKRTLIIPADQAYGANAQGSIPANAPLIFEIEVVSVTAP
ncbi:FKBP-type peptidyl-prolyl cis-trans isomerase [Duganella sp. CF458]|uniref:FKBP-type peptidyl-prolyl cis-trans isomerase n=1 Tax=Duganella sp. CF458 TaxID=1884368 RepID=UPI0008E39744|nr:FKBP-type peptidyl-prolyl cis-trans isomerase [Duganella sp. CF458]SFF59385.1 FKBP-type peptidyl-prolyl cis-trans isomerase [Duganella sp. CF458]